MSYKFLTPVFTEEYWQPITTVSEQTKARIVKLPKGAKQEVYSLCAEAATSVAAGNPLETIPAGTELTYQDCEWTQPGTVLLYQYECLLPIPSSPYKLRNHLADENVMRPDDTHELSLAPRHLFLNSFRSDRSGNTYVVSYYKQLRNHNVGMDYTTHVGLAVYAQDTSGDTICFPQVTWRTPDKSKVQGQHPINELQLKRESGEITVGQTYKWETKAGHELMRLKSAQLCFRGNLEYMKARKQSKKLSLFGRTALVNGTA